VRRYLLGDEGVQEYERKRLALKTRLERLKRLYLDGLIADGEYDAERDEIGRLQAEMSVAALPEVERAGEMVVSVREAWALATPQERHQMLALMFEEITIKGDEIAAIRPTAAFHPLFLLWRKRRDSNAMPQILPPRKGEHER